MHVLCKLKTHLSQEIVYACKLTAVLFKGLVLRATKSLGYSGPLGPLFLPAKSNFSPCQSQNVCPLISACKHAFQLASVNIDWPTYLLYKLKWCTCRLYSLACFGTTSSTISLVSIYLAYSLYICISLHIRPFLAYVHQ